jgi:hypothetical protein
MAYRLRPWCDHTLGNWPDNAAKCCLGRRFSAYQPASVTLETFGRVIPEA